MADRIIVVTYSLKIKRRKAICKLYDDKKDLNQSLLAVRSQAVILSYVRPSHACSGGFMGGGRYGGEGVLGY